MELHLETLRKKKNNKLMGFNFNNTIIINFSYKIQEFSGIRCKLLDNNNIYKQESKYL